MVTKAGTETAVEADQNDKGGSGQQGEAEGDGSEVVPQEQGENGTSQDEQEPEGAELVIAAGEGLEASLYTGQVAIKEGEAVGAGGHGVEDFTAERQRNRGAEGRFNTEAQSRHRETQRKILLQRGRGTERQRNREDF
jgi:hypothetical protein